MSITTREERAAILLNGLGTDTAENVLRRLSPEQGSRLRTQMQRLNGTTEQRELLGAVVDEFGTWLRGPNREARERPKVDRWASVPAQEEPDDPVAALRRLPVDRLAAALNGEHARTVSLVLDMLDADRAGEVLKRLPLDLRRDASLHLGQGMEGNTVLMQRIARALVQKGRPADGPPAVAGSAVPPRAAKIADMLRALDRAERTELLAALEQRDPETAARVKDSLYRFEDLAHLADRSLQKLLAEIDLRTLALALHAAPEAVAAKVLGNLSPRVQESVNDEAKQLTPIAPIQVQLARRAIVETFQRLDETDEMFLEG